MIYGGLKPLPEDKRDFKFGSIFGAVPLSQLPTTFVYPVIKIEDQKDTDFCTAFASTSVREDQEFVDLTPLYTFAKLKQLEGSPDGWGGDLRMVAKTHCQFGALEKKDCPYTIDTPREVIANWINWNKRYDTMASAHKAQSFTFVNKYSGMDLFDSIRMAIWLGRNKKQTVLTGALWKHLWTLSDGILRPSDNDEASPHAFKINGWKEIEGTTYLSLVLSNGTGIGQGGIFYMPREIANTELIFGNIVFTDLPKNLAWTANQLPFLSKLILALQNLLKKYDTAKC